MRVVKPAKFTGIFTEPPRVMPENPDEMRAMFASVKGQKEMLATIDGDAREVLHAAGLRALDEVPQEEKLAGDTLPPDIFPPEGAPPEVRDAFDLMSNILFLRRNPSNKDQSTREAIAIEIGFQYCMMRVRPAEKKLYKKQVTGPASMNSKKDELTKAKKLCAIQLLADLDAKRPKGARSVKLGEVAKEIGSRFKCKVPSIRTIKRYVLPNGKK